MNVNTIRQQVLGRATQSASFRARLLKDATSAIEEDSGFPVPKGLSVAAHDDPAHGLQVVVSGAAPLSDEELAGIAGGGFMGSDFETEAEANAAWQEQFPGSTPPWVDD